MFITRVSRSVGAIALFMTSCQATGFFMTIWSVGLIALLMTKSCQMLFFYDKSVNQVNCFIYDRPGVKSIALFRKSQAVVLSCLWQVSRPDQLFSLGQNNCFVYYKLVSWVN